MYENPLAELLELLRTHGMFIIRASNEACIQVTDPYNNTSFLYQFLLASIELRH